MDNRIESPYSKDRQQDEAQLTCNLGKQLGLVAQSSDEAMVMKISELEDGEKKEMEKNKEFTDLNHQ